MALIRIPPGDFPASMALPTASMGLISDPDALGRAPFGLRLAPPRFSAPHGIPTTATGMRCIVFAPLPSSPDVSRPQHITVPVESSAHA